jgi:hypothetical protein
MTLNNRIEALLRLPAIPRKTENPPVTGFLFQTERSILKMRSRPIDSAGARMWYNQEYHKGKLGALVGPYTPGDPLDYMNEEEVTDLTEYIEELETKVSSRIGIEGEQPSRNNQARLPFKEQ